MAATQPRAGPWHANDCHDPPSASVARRETSGRGSGLGLPVLCIWAQVYSACSNSFLLPFYLFNTLGLLLNLATK